jgi:hypothetical protein
VKPLPTDPRTLRRLRIEYALRKEREELLAGWRRRHPVAGDEERAELKRWADAAHESIRALESELQTLAARAA